ncbi:hypothetical protein [Amphritea atlantica]|uniref:hypothetical protein n=1 Tax=Amphritea atlantica TaxID=355243 RepID=UPI001114587C|nr:hypothetical protein [Amphritea atlantica]
MNLFKTTILTLSLLLVSLSSRAEPSNEAFEKQLDFTIRSACHGYMVDALPNFLSGVRSWLNASSPFCQTVRTLPDDQSAYAELKRENPSVDYRNDPEYKITVGGYNADRDRFNDCNDWMCEHIRKQVYHKGHPISLADYNKVEQHCKGPGEYNCIEHWFKSWPRPLPPLKTQQADTGMSLDAMMATESPLSEKAQQAPVNPSNLSLDSMLAEDQPAATTTPQPSQAYTKGPDTSLDNIYAAREQLALDDSMKSIRGYNERMKNRCKCSLNNTGCYQLPDESLLDRANKQEQQRYQACMQWQEQRSIQPASSQAADQQLKMLASLEKQINTNDEEITDAINDWKRQRREQIAQQQQEASDRSSTGYLAGMASILLQAGAVANGNISVEQASQNAVQIANSVESGESWGSAMGNTLTSSITNLPRSGSGTGTGTSSADAIGNFSFSCYTQGVFICTNYTLHSKQRFEQFKQQCQQAGSRIVSSCDSNAPSCTQSSSTGQQTTYDYTSGSDDLKQKCQANGGSFRPG